MEINEIISIITVIGGSIGVLLTAIAGLLTAINNKRKGDREEKTQPLDSSERIEKMAMGLVERLSDQIDKLDARVDELSELLITYKKENQELKRFIENIFDSLEEKIKEIRWDQNVSEECVDFLEVILVLVRELKDLYEEN